MVKISTCYLAAMTSCVDPVQGKLIAEQYSSALDISASTPSISWSLAKSVTSALVGIRSGDGGVSVRRLATTPVWNASETASRNITSARTLGPFAWTSRDQFMHEHCSCSHGPCLI